MDEEVKDVEVKKDDRPSEPEPTPVEKEAMEMGWVPKDQWKGAEEDWTPAKAFVKYGRLESELKRERAEGSQKEKVIKSMKGFYLNVKEDVKKEVEDTLRRAKKEAIKSEDYARAAEIDLQLEELKDNVDRQLRKHDAELTKVEQAPQGPPPEFYEWNRKNSWYVINSNDPLTKEADVLAVAYLQNNPNAKYTELLEYVEDRVKKLYPEKFVNPNKERPADVNEPGEATEGKPNKNKVVRLTEAEKRAAEAFGLSYEEYAKGLKEWDSKKGYA